MNGADIIQNFILILSWHIQLAVNKPINRKQYDNKSKPKCFQGMLIQIQHVYKFCVYFFKNQSLHPFL